MKNNITNNFYKIFHKSLIFVIFFIITFFLLMMSYNFIIKKKYIYYIDNFYHGIPNTIEYYQNEDQKKIDKIVTISNDENGFRNKKNSIHKKNILFLGDSFIRGINTEDNKLLSNILDKKIYNAGMDGFSTFNSVNATKYLFKKKKFEKVILFFTLTNDFRDNVFQKKYEENLKSRTVIFIKNNQFLNQIFKLRFLLNNKNNNKKLNISNINKPYYSINYLKLLINDKKFINETKLQTITAFKELKDFSFKNNAELLIIAIPDVAEIFKDINKIDNLSNDLKLEKLRIEDFENKVNYKNPKKVFYSICEEVNINCGYIPLDKESYFEIDHHWNNYGQQLAKNYLLENIEFLK